jgi:hypothetical protein
MNTEIIRLNPKDYKKSENGMMAQQKAAEKYREKLKARRKVKRLLGDRATGDEALDIALAEEQEQEDIVDEEHEEFDRGMVFGKKFKK